MLLAFVLSTDFVSIPNGKLRMAHDLLYFFYDFAQTGSGYSRRDRDHLSLIFAQQLILSVCLAKVCNGAKRNDVPIVLIQQGKLPDQLFVEAIGIGKSYSYANQTIELADVRDDIS